MNCKKKKKNVISNKNKNREKVKEKILSWKLI